MSNMVIGVIDGLGAVFFLLALFWGFHNFLHESEISEFWIAYSASMGTGFLFAMTKSVEWFGIKPELANLIQPFLATILGTVLVLTAVVCVVSPIERTVK